MKQLKLEKDVQLDRSYDELHAIEIKCVYDKNEEEDGIQVNGELLINAIASQNHVKKDFSEQVVLDLFVSKAKLDGTPFQLSLKKYDARLTNNLLHLDLDFEINGMMDENMKEIDDNAFGDLFENDDDTYICSVMAVVKTNDTYASIAHQNQVSEAVLREYNHNMVLEPKMLVRIPLGNEN